MKHMKIIAIAAALIALAVLAYRTYSNSQQDKARLEQDSLMIADMLKHNKPKE